jgi:two-component system, OmpR family, sensor kinase
VKILQSLQGRLGLSIGVLLTALWIVAAYSTALIVRNEMNEVFDSALKETAERILPLAVVEIVGRDEDGMTQRLAAVRPHEEFLTYVVRDATGRILLQSHSADPSVFAAYDAAGFSQNKTHRFYSDDALKGSIRITVAEPLDHRAAVAREIAMGLGLPLLIVLPIALIAIGVAVRASLAPLRHFRDDLATRHARDLSPVPTTSLPTEIAPVADQLNALLERLKRAFDAERSFASNAAHELRTPLAGAIAQAQRLRTETRDPAAEHRAADIEATLKRLTRLSERLIQLARAEGGPLRLDHSSDLRTVARIVVGDLAHGAGTDRIRMSLPAQPVMSDLDPDAFGIVCRNLVDNALRHGTPKAPVDVTLWSDGTFVVASEGPKLDAKTLSHLTERFARADTSTEGSGLGLAIVSAIAERIGDRLVLRSPRPGASSGFEASIRLPLQGSGQST